MAGAGGMVRPDAADSAEWETALRAQVGHATARLDAHRQQQLAQCAQFEATLVQNIATLQNMQLEVRRRAAALNAEHHASVERLNVAVEHAVELRSADPGLLVVVDSAAAPAAVQPAQNLVS
jgi:hypothetical protein